MKKFLLACCCSILFLSGYALAGDGTIGTTSSGESSIQVSIQQAMQITSVDNITIIIAPGDLGTTKTGGDDICVFSNQGSNYNVTVDSLNGDGNFVAVMGEKGINYTVQWDDGTTTHDLTENTAQLCSGASQVLDCGGEDNATIILSVNTSTGDVTAGTYTDTLTITIEPELS
jgi:hypothetical protein